ncbi:MAG: hypothetical protein RI601_02340 [Desulfurivibrionaceae bacterium]|nr:hypothetical protein [Desulfurivibrionaceae bacterium]
MARKKQFFHDQGGRNYVGENDEQAAPKGDFPDLRRLLFVVKDLVLSILYAMCCQPQGLLAAETNGEARKK